MIQLLTNAGYKSIEPNDVKLFIERVNKQPQAPSPPVGWQMVQLPHRHNWKSVCYGCGMYVISSSSYNDGIKEFDKEPQIIMSKDCKTWKSYDLPYYNNWNVISNNKDVIFALSNMDTIYYYDITTDKWEEFGGFTFGYSDKTATYSSYNNTFTIYERDGNVYTGINDGDSWSKTDTNSNVESAVMKCFNDYEAWYQWDKTYFIRHNGSIASFNIDFNIDFNIGDMLNINDYMVTDLTIIDGDNIIFTIYYSLNSRKYNYAILSCKMDATINFFKDIPDLRTSIFNNGRGFELKSSWHNGLGIIVQQGNTGNGVYYTHDNFQTIEYVENDFTFDDNRLLWNDLYYLNGRFLTFVTGYVGIAKNIPMDMCMTFQYS
jgi:hypothetical protein